MKNSNHPKPLVFQDQFDLSRGELQKILDIALMYGGEFSEIYLEYKAHSIISMEEDIIKETAESISMGAGIRVISGYKTGYGYTNDLNLAKMKKAALTAASIASKNKQQVSCALCPEEVKKSYYPVIRASHEEPLRKKIDLVKRAYLAAQNLDARIKKVKVVFSDQVQHIMITNSLGLCITDARPLLKLSCVAIAEQSSSRESGFSGGGGRVGLEYFDTTLSPEEIGQAAAKEAVQLLRADQPPAGEMPVVLAPGHSGVLIHEAVGHLLEADYNRKKTSIFWNKMGKRVGTDQISIIDDPTIPRFRGSYNMDDEGTIPTKTPLIHKGKVVGLLQDRLSARLMNKTLTGHGRRQDFSCIPIPRMSNTYIERGEYSPEEIIKSVGRGFYAQHYQGGQVEDSGKFTFSVSSGYLIEGGKLVTPIKQATLIGSNIDILNKITMIGSDLKFGLQTGTCGKEGQFAPVTDGCPTLKITEMTVGGQS